MTMTQPTTKQDSSAMSVEAELRAQNILLLGVYEAVDKLIKARGRFHTEQNYAALVAAYDLAKPVSSASQAATTEQAGATSSSNYLEKFASQRYGKPVASGASPAATTASASEACAECEEMSSDSNPCPYCTGRAPAPSREDAVPLLPVEYDTGLDRHYLPLPGGWEVQTKGKGSTFRIAHAPSDERWVVLDEHLHGPLEQMARDLRTALAGRATAPLDDLRTVVDEAAAVLESAAKHNREKGRTVLAHAQQDRADRLRAALAQPAAPVVDGELPPLPEPVTQITTGKGLIWNGKTAPVFTADQMREYGAACVAAASGAPAKKEGSK